MRVRLRISILILVASVVLSLSALHVRSVITGALEQAGTRARIVGEAVQDCLLDARETGHLLGSPLVRRVLSRSLAQDTTISNILVLDRSNHVIGSAAPWQPRPLAEWGEWQGHGVFWRSIDLFRSNSDIALDFPASPELPMRVRVLFSPDRLRAAVWPQLIDLAVLSLFSLIVSGIIAWIVSRLVSNALERIGDRIDRISHGELHPSDAASELPELATLDTKLLWLSRQFSGARTDIMRLRSNVETMLRQLDEAIIVFGPDNRLQMAGDPAERMLARSRDELLGQPFAQVFPQWTQAGTVLQRVAMTGESVREQPVQFERNNLEPMRLLMTVEPIDYGDGAGRGMLVALRDADTRSRLRSDLDTARRLAAISKITSGVAHEIKNPLNAMMLHLQIAQDKAEHAGDTRPELQVIGSELLRLDRVVKALLDFNRPLEPRLAEYDLVDLAGQVAALIRPQAEAQDCRVVLDSLVDGPALIMGDADLLKQGLMNIACNAIEAMYGRGAGVLRFTVEQSRGEYIVSVRDSGPGIPPEIRDRIFNLYFTTKKSAGTGLAITYRIVLLHSGSLTVDSEMGKGTCFRVGLPLPSADSVYFSTGSPAPV